MPLGERSHQSQQLARTRRGLISQTNFRVGTVMLFFFFPSLVLLNTHANVTVHLPRAVSPGLLRNGKGREEGII